MTSTPMQHPDDEARPHPEDQGEESSSTDEIEDLVDERTKRLSREEAEQHDDIIEAQQDEIDAEERTEPGSGYGH
ncbi:hypothetical protein [Brachybacterium atlanticum]|uniref:hypothetical protein n=1 Tax=Brachybacterium atlanticum TaxID=2911888 RepID=UPI0021E078D8|nr:hypothetical protein [Brachybacterium atlanticum]